jgi:N-acetyl-beta-hexosaminidase
MFIKQLAKSTRLVAMNCFIFPRLSARRSRQLHTQEFQDWASRFMVKQTNTQRIADADQWTNITAIIQLEKHLKAQAVPILLLR